MGKLWSLLLASRINKNSIPLFTGGESPMFPINEAKSNSRHDVEKLRMLYYGRLDLFVSFTDNEKYQLGGGKFYGVMATKVDDVVGRKPTIPTNKYAYVFRYQTKTDAVLDANNFPSTTLNEILQAMELLTFVDQDALRNAIGKVKSSSKYLGKSFTALLYVLSEVAPQTQFKQMVMSKIMMDLGYEIIIDKKGAYTFLNHSLVEQNSLHILPYQTFKEEDRINVTRKIDKINKRLSAVRGRVAKVQDDILPRVSFDVLTKQVIKDLSL
jgi:hypothetical protein